MTPAATRSTRSFCTASKTRQAISFQPLAGISDGFSAPRPHPSSLGVCSKPASVRLMGPFFLEPKKARLIPIRAATTIRSPDMRWGADHVFFGKDSRRR